MGLFEEGRARRGDALRRYRSRLIKLSDACKSTADRSPPRRQPVERDTDGGGSDGRPPRAAQRRPRTGAGSKGGEERCKINRTGGNGEYGNPSLAGGERRSPAGAWRGRGASLGRGWPPTLGGSKRGDNLSDLSLVIHSAFFQGKENCSRSACAGVGGTSLPLPLFA